MEPKRLIVANDLPGLGKVALAASLPILATCQVEAAVLPTVILSSHTGGFPIVHMDDYSQEAPAFLRQWQTIGLEAAGLVVGYTKSATLLKELVAFAKEEMIPIILDPIMGDGGKLYTGFDQTYVENMREVAREAVVLIPNLTEAALLTETDFLNEGYGAREIELLLEKLADLGPEQIILTGVSFATDQIGMAYYDGRTKQVTYHMGRKFPSHFFGTGDIVTTLIASAFAEGIPLSDMLPLILTFLERSLETTLLLDRDVKYGVFFEPHLSYLAQAFQTLKEKTDETTTTT